MEGSQKEKGGWSGFEVVGAPLSMSLYDIWSVGSDRFLCLAKGQDSGIKDAAVCRWSSRCPWNGGLGSSHWSGLTILVCVRAGCLQRTERVASMGNRRWWQVTGHLILLAQICVIMHRFKKGFVCINLTGSPHVAGLKPWFSVAKASKKFAPRSKRSRSISRPSDITHSQAP